MLTRTQQVTVYCAVNLLILMLRDYQKKMLITNPRKSVKPKKRNSVKVDDLILAAETRVVILS